MKKLSGNKAAVLILGGLSLLVLFLLVAGLGSVQLKTAKPFAYEQSSGSAVRLIPPTWKGLVYVIIFMAVVLIVLFILLPPEQRLKYIKAFGLVALVLFLAGYLLSYLGIGRAVQQQPENQGKAMISPVPGPTNTLAPEITPAVFAPPQITAWNSFFVTLILVLGLAGAGWWIVWSRRKTDTPYESLAQITLSGLKDIESGKDWGNAILNTYQRMNRAVTEWRGIHRKASMTTSEFAEYLESLHLPKDAVRDLTILFERVRYGEKESTSKDIQDAVVCLKTILDYCQRAK